MARLSVVRVSVAALFALSASASDVCAAGAEGVCQDGLNDASSLLAVNVQVHNFGKAGVAASSDDVANAPAEAPAEEFVLPEEFARFLPKEVASDDAAELEEEDRLVSLIMETAEDTDEEAAKPQPPPITVVVGGIAGVIAGNSVVAKALGQAAGSLAGMLGGQMAVASQPNMTSAGLNQMAIQMASSMTSMLSGIVKKLETTILPNCMKYSNTLKSALTGVTDHKAILGALEKEVNDTVGQYGYSIGQSVTKLQKTGAEAVAIMKQSGQKQWARIVQGVIHNMTSKAQSIANGVSSIPYIVAKLDQQTNLTALDQDITNAISLLNQTLYSTTVFQKDLDTGFGMILKSAMRSFVQATNVTGVRSKQLIGYFATPLQAEKNITQRIVWSMAITITSINDGLRAARTACCSSSSR